MIKALITLYYPSEDQMDRVKLIASQVDMVYICDNTPCKCHETYYNISNVIYMNWGENKGISKAYNMILKNKRLSWSNNDFIIFFDQDTMIEEGHVNRLIKEYELLKGNGINIGCLGPYYYNTSNQTLELPKKKIRISKNTLKMQNIITSSMLCKYGDLKKVGFWNERVFLDMADWDLCWRFINKGYLCCMTGVSVITHTVGIGEKRFGKFSLRVGMPIREYYQLRDCRYLLRKKYTPSKYKILFVLMLTVRSWLHLILYDERKKRLYYMICAMIDYYKGIQGSFER